MSTVSSSTGLSKEDLSYIRRANDYYCTNRDGQNYLVCVKRGRFGDAFSEDVKVEIPVAGNGADGYFTTGWEFPWATHGLRQGDELSLYWYPDAWTNDNLRDAGLHCDVLYLDIRRGSKQWRYVVAASTCPHNSSARMCRGAS